VMIGVATATTAEGATTGTMTAEAAAAAAAAENVEVRRLAGTTEVSDSLSQRMGAKMCSATFLASWMGTAFERGPLWSTRRCMTTGRASIVLNK